MGKKTENRRKRVCVVVNKWWECDPLMAVLLHNNARPWEELKWPAVLHHPRQRPNPKPVSQPRAVFNLKQVDVEVWCVSDLLEDLADKPEYQSSSERKAERLPQIFKGAKPDLVIAVGTAGYPWGGNENGSVVVGTNIFMYDAYPVGNENEYSRWHVGPFGKVIPSSLKAEQFAKITALDPKPPSVTDRFLVPPLNPVGRGLILAGHDTTALGVVNVTDYAKYAETDAGTLGSYLAAGLKKAPAKSLETTHCLIRVQSEAPFLFVSGIVDRVGYFHEEVDPRPYAQNTSGAHNAGVVVAWMLPRIDATL